MTLFRKLSRSPAVWVAPLFWFFVWDLASSEKRFADPYYGVSTTGAALYPIFAIVSVSAACGAWEGGRLRRGQVWQSSPVRQRIIVAVDALGPVFLVGFLSLAVSCLATTGNLANIFDTGSLVMLLFAAVLISLYALIGFAIGCLIPSFIAVPVSLIGSYLWMGIPGSLEIMWLRHLTGQLTDIPGIGQRISYEALLAPVLLTASLALSILVLIALRTRMHFRVTISILIAFSGIGGSYSIVSDWGPQTPLEKEKLTGVCIKDNGILSCLPREYSSHLPIFEETAHQVVEDLQVFGIARPDKVEYEILSSESDGVTWKVFSYPGQPTEEMISEISRGAFSLDGNCEIDRAGDGARKSAIYAWLALTAGADSQYIGYLYEPEAVSIAQNIRSLSTPEQTEWYTAQISHYAHCSAS
ncbi:DUF7224 domain-containing protein [Streptomyces xiamenensis]|uniref:DUF7224 domain-containing protein n=1 Tax=Streptomyces xiamenensis TaxID=408015 RepID=UPI0035D65FB1